MKPSIPGTVAVFAVVMPAVVTAAVMVSAYWYAMNVSPLLLLQIVVGGMPGGYLVGLGPAIMTGLVAVWLSQRISRSWMWILLAVAAGILFAIVGGWFIDPDGRLIGPNTILRLLAPAGGTAALLSALICLVLNLRPRSVA